MTSPPCGPPAWTERSPPSDPEAEMALLGSLLLSEDTSAIERTAAMGLVANDFTDKRHRVIWEGIVALAIENAPPQPLLLRNYLRQQGRLVAAGGEAYITVLAQAGFSPALAEQYAKVVLEQTNLRRLYYAQEVAARSIGEGRPSKEVASALEAAIRDVRAGAGPSRAMRPGEPLTYSYDDEEEIAPRWAVHPVLQMGELTTLFAFPKAGKSILAMYIASCALRGWHPIPGAWTLGRGWQAQRVLILTEMTPREAKRYFTTFFDPHRVLAGRVRFLTYEAESLVSQGSRSLIETVRAATEEMGGADMIIVDTLTKWAMAEGGEHLNDMGPAVRFFDPLRRLCSERGIVGLIVAHARKGNGEGLSFDDILGSQAIRGATSTNVGAILHNPDTTVVELFLEGRNPEHVIALARRATALAEAREPPPLGGANRRWYVRLDYNDGLLRYVLAEPHLLPGGAEGAPARHESQAVVASVQRVMERLTVAAARTGEPRAFGVERRILPAVSVVWTEQHGTTEEPPGRVILRRTLEGMPDVVHVALGSYPGNGRVGGWGLARYLPKPLGEGRDPIVHGEDGAAIAVTAPPVEDPATRYRRELEAAQSCVRAALRDGPRKRRAVLAGGKSQGHAEKILREAADVLGVVAKHDVWELPADLAPGQSSPPVSPAEDAAAAAEPAGPSGKEASL